MSAAAGQSEIKNPKTGMTHAEMKEFIRNHFEELVNRKNLGIGETNFAPGFVDHGADIPAGMPPGPAGAIQYVGAALRKVPDLHVSIEDMIAEDDKVVVRNHWTGTDAALKQRLEFSGIVIWRIANRQILDRYIVREVFRHALLGLVVFTFVLFVPKLIRLMELFVRHSGSGAQVLKLFLCIFPAVFVFTVPMATLIG